MHYKSAYDDDVVDDDKHRYDITSSTQQ